MKKFLVVLLIVILNSFGLAQYKLRLTGGSAIPLGSFENYVEVGFGGAINFSFNTPVKNLDVSVGGGYYFFGLKESLPDYHFDYKSYSALIGLRYNFTDYDFIPYVGLEGGAYLNNYELTAISKILGNETFLTSETSYGISPEVGFRMNITPLVDVDVNAKYNRIRSLYVSRAFLQISSGITLRF